MKVLVAGSEGSLMQAVIPVLINEGHDVVGVDNFFRHGKIDRSREYAFIEGDLADEDFVRNGIPRDIDCIIQAAARIFGVSGFHAYPADILAHDLVLHQNLLWLAKELERLHRVVYVSSSMVYERCDSVPSPEEDVDDSRIPYTDYGLSKLVCERLCRAFYHQYGLPFTIWRPFNIITPFEGAEQMPGFAHVFADLIDKVIVRKENPVKLIGDGEQVRCFTWIEDVADAIGRYSFDDRTLNETFNLGNPEPITVKDLAQLVFEEGQRLGAVGAAQKLRFEHLPAFTDDVRIRVPCIDKVTRALGWTPRLKVRESIRRCVEQAAAQQETTTS